MATLTLRLRGVHAEIVDRMVEAGMAKTRVEAVGIALLQFGRLAGLVDERSLFKAFQRIASSKPLSDRSVFEGTRKAKLARTRRR